MEKKLFLSLMVQKHGGARGIGLETPELLRSMFRLSNIFSIYGCMGCHRLSSKTRRKTLTDIIGAYTASLPIIKQQL